jgi:signal transduction histidine kinase/ActR/RegA family two-component response regulator
MNAARRPDQILADLVSNCTASADSPGALGAAFTVIGALRQVRGVSYQAHMAVPAVDFLWKSGEPEWINNFENLSFTNVWRQALAENRLTAGGSETHLSDGTPRGTARTFIHVVAVPFESDGQQTGVLVVGFDHLAASPGTLERIELRASLAATVLAGRARSQEEARLAAWRKSLLDNVAQATVLLDEDGGITGTSVAACRLLGEQLADNLREPRPQNREMAGTRSDRGGVPHLRQLFEDSDQLRIETWSARALSGTADRRGEPRHGPEELPEATLSNGVRVRLRPALPAGGRFAAVTLERCEESQTAAIDSRAESELTSVLEWLDEGVILFDAQDRVRSLNSRFLQITGLQASDAADFPDLDALISKLSQRIVGPWNFAQRWRNLARGIDGGVREELEFFGPSPRIVQRMSRPILDGSGRRLGRLEIYLDLTGRRGFQTKLLRTEKLAALGQLITGIAHELSSPLTSILGYSQYLLQKEQSGVSVEETRQVRHIFEEAERATAILRQLLSNAHENKPRLGPVAVNELVLQGLELQKISLLRENITVETDLDSSGPMVYGDPGQLQQVFLNLTGNARQALDQAGKSGTIRVRTKQIGEQRVLLEIADDGPGIPRDILGRIFDPFFTTKPAGIGTGLGLAIVSGIVREHGGHVNVASPPGGGAIFSVALMAASHASGTHLLAPSGDRMLHGYLGGTPAPFPVPNPSARASELPANEELSAHASNRILVVEDEPTVARLIADVLQDDGFQVDVLLDGQEALKQASRESYDLVICDMKMPGVDGQHFYKALVQAHHPLSKRFLFVTGDIVASHTQQFLEAHRVPHVAKPFRMEELKDQVHAVLGHDSQKRPYVAGAGKIG